MTDQQAHEKKLKLMNHHGNANQNNEISTHTCWDGHHQKDVLTDELLERIGNPCALLVGM